MSVCVKFFNQLKNMPFYFFKDIITELKEKIKHLNYYQYFKFDKEEE